jgi:exo-1,4-beta-D-glucosaminidase
MQGHDSEHERSLSRGWLIRTSIGVSAGGEAVSRPDFDTSGWIEASVPSTILATLVANGRCPDPYTGMNLQAIPREPFLSPWWYRTEFALAPAEARRTILLEFDGINYAADIWLNGRQIATAGQARGAFRRFQYDVSPAAVPGVNVLAVKIAPPQPGDFSIGFVDWNPPAPDRNMGLFRPVRLRFCDGVSIENPLVRTDLNLDTLKEAWLTVSAEVANHGERAVRGVLEGRIEGMSFRQDVHLEPGATKTAIFAPDAYPDLHFANPRLWWPHDLGKPELYLLDLRFVVDAQVCDTRTVRFGIREVTDYWTPEGQRGFRVNGQEVLIKGAGWTDDLLLADTPETIAAEIQYVRHMGLNCIRCEGIWGKDQTLYDLCDQYGILVMAGWSCHWEHEQYLGKPVDERYGGVTTPEDIELVSRSWRDQLLWLRNHPSIFVWAVASDKLPAPELEQKYRDIFRACDPTRPYLASTGGVGSEQRIICKEELTSAVSGSSGVKMLGPYEYTPPVYWYTDTRRGGAYGFNTETSPGAAVPTLESIRKMIPPDHLWPIDRYWDFHCGLNEFNTLDKYRRALAQRYGPAGGVEEFLRKAQTLNYELMRPMFEAFRVNRGRAGFPNATGRVWGPATGVIQWMLNAAWPKMYWQLYDWYLMPTGAFYGAKKACEPQQLVYHYGDHCIYLLNDLPAVGWVLNPRVLSADGLPPRGLRTHPTNLTSDIRVYDIESKLVLAARLPADTGNGTSKKVFQLPHLDRLSNTYFLNLRLLDASNAEIARNFYWLSTKLDVLDYQAKVEPWEYHTLSKEYADLTLLNHLPPAQVDVRYELGANGEEVRVELANRSDKIAFFLELLLTEPESGEPIVPVFWQDNYVSLLPNETRVLSAALSQTRQAPVLTVRGWNIEPLVVSL